MTGAEWPIRKDGPPPGVFAPHQSKKWLIMHPLVWLRSAEARREPTNQANARAPSKPLNPITSEIIMKKRNKDLRKSRNTKSGKRNKKNVSKEKKKKRYNDHEEDDEYALEDTKYYYTEGEGR